LCDPSVRASSSVSLQRHLAASAALSLRTAGADDALTAESGAGTRAGGHDDGGPAVTATSTVVPLNRTVTVPPRRSSYANVSVVSQWCLWFGSTTDDDLAASEVVDDHTTGRTGLLDEDTSGQPSEANGLHAFCQPPVLWILLLPLTGFVLCFVTGFCYSCFCIHPASPDTSAVGIKSTAQRTHNARLVERQVESRLARTKEGRRDEDSVSSMASVSSLSSQSSHQTPRKKRGREGGRKERKRWSTHGGRERSIGVQNPDATAWDTVNPLYPDAESWKRRPRNGTIPENFSGAFDFESPPRSPPPEREMAFDFDDAGSDGYVARWSEDRGKREPAPHISRLEFSPANYASVVNGMSLAELRDSCAELQLDSGSSPSASTEDMRAQLLRYYAPGFVHGSIMRDRLKQVRKTPSWPRSRANSSLF
jgi:hypothetical protein